MFDEIEKKYALVHTLVEAIADEQLTILSKFLKARISCPDSYVVMMGETSSGKSTLLNGLLRENLLYTSARPSTGAIVELVFEKDGDHSFYAINKNATIEELSRDDFTALCKNPDDNLERIRLQTASALHGMGRLRLFDTPGYGSLIEKHEKVLSDFLPQSDLIIYTVLYKIGIQQDDFNFLNYAAELIGGSIQNRETEFVLVINRVPDNVSPGDSRIREIAGYVSDILHYTPKMFLVPNFPSESDEYPLPLAGELWDYVQRSAASPENQKRLEDAFTGYVFGLLEKCEEIIERRLFALKATNEEKEFLAKKIEELKKLSREIKTELIEPTFNEIVSALPARFERARNTAQSIIMEKIEAADKFREIEITAYVNHHLLQFEIKKQVDEIRFYLDAKLHDLDRKVQDKLNTAYAEIQKEIDLHFSVAAANMAKSMFKNIGGRALEQSLLGYFRQFAGRGGTGIANGAKHLLKKFGDLFGKTFSRETHNKLAHVLSKIGATSAKAVGAAVAVVIETIAIIVDILTWQGKLKKAVDKGLDTWYNEVVVFVTDDLLALKKENIRLMEQDIAQRIDAFTTRFEEKDLSLDDTERLQAMFVETKSRLGDYDAQ